MRKAIFLDRDGVINKACVIDGKPFPPKNLSELEILPGVNDALNNLHKSNYLIFIITNQPDVARGLIRKSDVESINKFLLSKLVIDEIKTCYHDDSDNCDCRKPKPGSLFKLADKFKVDLKNSFMIGDRWRDIQAGKKAGCTTIFIDYEYNELVPHQADYKVKSLLDAKKIILGE